MLSALLLFMISATAFSPSARADDLPPWADSLGSAADLRAVHTIGSDAQVTVSDGTAFATSSLYHDPQRAAFRQVYPDGAATMGVDGRYIWSYDGQAETEAPPFVERFVLGHQLHAQILFFGDLHGGVREPAPARFGGQACLGVTSADEHTSWTLYYLDGGRPLGLVIDREPEPDITITLDAWRTVGGVALPHEIDIDDGERTFRYSYTNITLNEGALDGFRAPLDVLTDEQKLLRLHRVAMDDHFFGRTEGLTATRADSLVIVSDGEIQMVGGDAFDTMMSRIMASRDYTVYDDLVRPRVEVSADGTLGQVVAQVFARGVRYGAAGEPDAPFAFTCAWLSTYRKIDGAWYLAGNISNFKPDGGE